MNLNLRQAILQRMQNKSDDELKEVIESSIGGEDRVLPGLGVLLEVIWKNSDPSTQNHLVQTLKQHVQLPN